MPDTSADTHTHTNSHTHTHGYTQIHSGQTHKTAGTSHNTVGVNLRQSRRRCNHPSGRPAERQHNKGALRPKGEGLSVAASHHVSPLITITHDMKVLSHTTEL